MKLVSKT